MSTIRETPQLARKGFRQSTIYEAGFLIGLMNHPTMMVKVQQYWKASSNVSIFKRNLLEKDDEECGWDRL